MVEKFLGELWPNRLLRSLSGRRLIEVVHVSRWKDEEEVMKQF